MALDLRWYDAACIAIVGAAMLVSVFVVCFHGRSRRGAAYERSPRLLLLGEVDDDRVGEAEAEAEEMGYESCWQGLHPGWLLLLRLVSAGVLVGLLAADVRKYDFLIFVYYTEWTFTLVIVYFALGSLVSAHGCWKYSRWSSSVSEEGNEFFKLASNGNGQLPISETITIENASSSFLRLQGCGNFNGREQSAGFWGCTMQILYQTCAGGVVLTDVVFWGLIVPFLRTGHFSLNILMGCMHTLNLVFLLLDTALNNMPFPMFGASYFVIWSCVYVIFQWILHACGFSWWPYPFLELSTPWAPLWYFIMAVVHVPCYVFYYLLVKAKDLLFSKLFPGAYKKL